MLGHLHMQVLDAEGTLRYWVGVQCDLDERRRKEHMDEHGAAKWQEQVRAAGRASAVQQASRLAGTLQGRTEVVLCQARWLRPFRALSEAGHNQHSLPGTALACCIHTTPGAWEPQPSD
jgi:hypothetical protein